MQYRFHGNVAHIEKAQELVKRKAQRLRRQFADVPEDLLLLDVSLHYHEKTDSYRARLLFRAPTQQITADGHWRTLGTAIRRAFGDLYVQVEGYLATARGEPLIRREQRIQQAKREAATTPPVVI